MRQRYSVFGIAGFCLIAAGCSSGPQPPQPGTPAFLWSAAKTKYRSGDFLKANESLSQLANSDSEFAAKSQPWSIMISAGMARAYQDLADNFDAGARVNRANPTPFRRQSSAFRSQASGVSMQYVETVHKFLAAKPPDTIGLDLGFPNGSAAEPVQLQRVAKGMLVPPAEIEALQQDMVQRGVLLSVTYTVTGAVDSAKALDIFQKGEVKVERPMFLTAVAKALLDQADLFGPKKLDRPERATMLCNEAEEALKAVPATKTTRELMARLAKLRKSSKTT